MNEEEFRRSEKLFQTAGYEVVKSWYDEKLFGSWAIELVRDGMPKQQVIWDGKDGWLKVETFASSGTWMNKWIGKKKAEQTAEVALAQLSTVVTREWEKEIESERADYWKKFQLKQALSRAGRLWERGCYEDYVREISPYLSQLSPAQLKRFQIAQKRGGKQLQSSSS